MGLSNNYRYPKSLSGNFQDFVESLNTASVTYEIESIIVDDHEEQIPDIRFNLHKTITRFERSIQQDFVLACDDIEQELNKTYAKQDKLNLINSHAVEIEAVGRMLSKDVNGLYTHRRFSFENVSEDPQYAGTTMSEAAFQDYYYWIEHFTLKMQSYLHKLRDMVLSIPQDQVKLPHALLPDPNGSSLQNPIGFFDFLLLRNGIQSLLTEFIPTSEEMEYGQMGYDEKTQTVTELFVDDETGEWEEEVSRFTDFYWNRLFKETTLSQQLIQERILQMNNEAEARYFLTVTMDSLQHLYSVATKNEVATKYDATPKPIISLLRLCYQRYVSLCPPPTKAIEQLLELNSDNKLPTATKQLSSTETILGFRMIARLQIQTLVVVLHKSLSEATMIHADTDLELLKQAFLGKPYDHPLRIRWTDKGKNRMVNKRSLFYLIEQLAHAGLIEPINEQKNLFQKINHVFVDEGGKNFENLEESYNEYKKARNIKTNAQKVIDKAIAVIVNMLP